MTLCSAQLKQVKTTTNQTIQIKGNIILNKRFVSNILMAILVIINVVRI